MADNHEPRNANSQEPARHRVTAAAETMMWFGPDGEVWTNVGGRWEKSESKGKKAEGKPIWGPKPEYHFHGGVDPKVSIMYFGPDTDTSTSLPS